MAGAKLSITGVQTDGSTLSFSTSGVLTSHAVYDVTLEASDDSLPDGEYHLQLWNNFNLLASTDQPFAEYYSSPSPPAFFDESAGITVQDGVGHGMLDLRTKPVEDLIMARERTNVTMTLYDSQRIYLPGRQGAQIIRNEAGLYLADFELQNPENSIIEGEKTFTEFPETPEDTPSDAYQVANRKFVLDQVGDPSNISDPLQAFSNLSPTLEKAGDISASESKGYRIILVTDTSEERLVTISSDNLIEDLILYVKDKSGHAGVNPITIQVENGETIDGLSSVEIMDNYGCLVVYSDGNNLFNLNSSVVIR